MFKQPRIQCCCIQSQTTTFYFVVVFATELGDYDKSLVTLSHTYIHIYVYIRAVKRLKYLIVINRINVIVNSN
jgi:hypothetical protein